MGFKLSIDDFGTGYSSLAYLKRLPVDELKIDQSFVRNMQSDRDDEMIVRSTIDLAHNLGITVVAEGVETAEAWNLLRELKCDQAQGYLHGPADAGRRVLGLVDELGHAPRRPVDTDGHAPAALTAWIAGEPGTDAAQIRTRARAAAGSNVARSSRRRCRTATPRQRLIGRPEALVLRKIAGPIVWLC